MQHTFSPNKYIKGIQTIEIINYVNINFYYKWIYGQKRILNLNMIPFILLLGNILGMKKIKMCE